MKQTVRRSGGTVSIDTDNLAKLSADIEKNGKARVHVGILGRTTTRSDGTLSNADIGAVHEFGILGGYSGSDRGQEARRLGGPNAKAAKRNIPARSWLRMPVISHLPDQLKKQKIQVWHAVILKLGLRGALKVLGALAVASIQEAFATGGWGTWAKLAPFTIRKKGSSAILIDSAQLRQGVTSEVMG